MIAGYKNKVVGQTGEYLVAAELSRRGYITTTFTGNVPFYDIIASDIYGRMVLVQVKAGLKPSWQFSDITKFCQITFDGRKQIIGSPQECPVQRLVVVFVKVGEDRDDQFYILTWEELRDVLINLYQEFLDRHDGIRPRRWNSYHAAIRTAYLGPYQDQWDIVQQNLVSIR